MKLMIPFYYILVALLFGLVGGFCARCYQYSYGDFFRVLKGSTEIFTKVSVGTFLLPLLVMVSEDFRKRLLKVLISGAADDYNEKEQGAVKLNANDIASLVNLFLAKISVFNFVRIAANMSLFYFFNLDIFANAIMKKVAETPQSEQSPDLNVRGISFYKNNVLARTLFCL